MMEFAFAVRKDYQVNPEDDLEDREEDISFFIIQININTSFLDKTIVKLTMQPLKFSLKLQQHLLSTDTNTVALVVSPTT